MLKDLRVAFIGSGVMAEAILQGLLRQSLVSSSDIVCADPFPQRCDDLAARFEVETTTSNPEAVHAADLVILSVKPQVLREVLRELRGAIKPTALVLSIVAGATIETISRELGHAAVVRSMPNTPARIGEGMTVWTASAAVEAAGREQARLIFGALGEEVHVDHEEYLDMATALSGTGPAYVFLVMEALIDAGVHLGFSRRIAQQLVLQTMQGSVAFARSVDMHPAELRNMVTSPGGTSAEAIYQLEKGGLRTILSRAVFAAFQKSRSLSQMPDKHGSSNGAHPNPSPSVS
jgi:pyrroline-5-carboxylate reductase